MFIAKHILIDYAQALIVNVWKKTHRALLLAVLLVSETLAAVPGDEMSYQLSLVEFDENCTQSLVQFDEDEQGRAAVAVVFNDDLHVKMLSGAAGYRKNSCSMAFSIQPSENHRLLSVKFHAQGQYTVSPFSLAAARLRLRVNHSGITKSTQFSVGAGDEANGEFMDLSTEIILSEQQTSARTVLDCGAAVYIEADLYAEVSQSLDAEASSGMHIVQVLFLPKDLVFEPCGQYR